MKKYNDIVNDINMEWKNISILEEKHEVINDEIKALFCEKSLKEKVIFRKENKEMIEEKECVLKTIEDEIRDTKLKIKIMKNNAKIAMFHETMPVVLDILKKYENKPHGEKTSKKIRDEIFDKTDCRVYISNGSYKIYSRYDIEVGLKYINGKKESLLPNNKVYAPMMEDLEIYYIKDKYIEDIESYIDELKRLHVEIYNMKNELDNLMNKYNDLAVDGIKYLYNGKAIYDYVEFE